MERERRAVILKFPGRAADTEGGKSKAPTTVEQEVTLEAMEYALRIERIQQSLSRINKLMEKLSEKRI